MRILRLLLLLSVGAIALLSSSQTSGREAIPADVTVPSPFVPCNLAVGETQSTLGLADSNCPVSRTAPAALVSGPVTAIISGTVTEEGSGVPLADVCVTLRDGTGLFDGMVRTDESGAFEFQVAPRYYKVWFVDCGTPGYHIPEWHDNQPTYDDAVAVLPIQPTVVDAALAPGGGAISGVVTDDVTHAGIADVCVSVFDEGGYRKAFVFGDAQGSYAAEGLASGAYHVLFAPCSTETNLIFEWNNNAERFAESDTVSVQTGQKTTVNAALGHGGSLHGHVSPSEPTCVDVYDADTGAFAGFDITGNDGDYRVGGLRPREYVARFSDCAAPLFLRPEWYNDANQFSDATPVRIVGPASDVQLNQVSMRTGGSITGSVRSGSILLSSICVAVFDANGDVQFETITDAGGYYEAGGLPRGPYKVWYYDCRDEPRLPARWFGDSSTSVGAANANVNDNSVRAIGETSLTAGALVNGTVTRENDGRAFAGACVLAYTQSSYLVGLALTDGLGKYTLPLFTGFHNIWFGDCTGENRYHPEWYNDEPYFDFADHVAVGAIGSKRPNVNAALGLLILGDASCNGSVDSIDAALVLQATAGFYLIECPFNADPNEDVSIDAIDAALILQYVAGLLSEF